ncbi:olfactory receptor 10A7-like [Gastrophryne carolinensis]
MEDGHILHMPSGFEDTGWSALEVKLPWDLRQSEVAGDRSLHRCVNDFPLTPDFVNSSSRWLAALASYRNNVTTIILLGFHNIGKCNALLFTFIFMIYYMTICGNFLIITLVFYSKSLRTPMYFFLTQLSIADIMLTTDISPNMLHIVLYKRTSISFSGCITQSYFFIASEASECFLLMVMSYDRYLAICSPLHYTSIMTQTLCNKLAFASWLLGCCTSLELTRGICQLLFCGPNIIDHYFCDFIPLLELSCSDTSMLQLEDIFLSIPVVITPFVFIVISYMNIVLSILNISSFTGRLKAFSTCSSHLTVVSLFYGTLIVMYILPNEGHSRIISTAMSMLYTVFTPFLNPLIYSLRNKDIKDALRHAIWSQQQRVGLIISLLQGDPQSWAFSLLPQDPARQSVEVFFSAMEILYNDPDRGATADAKLRTLRQGRRQAEEYCSEFVGGLWILDGTTRPYVVNSVWACPTPLRTFS